MSAKDNGGNAFPIQEHNGDGSHYWYHAGMTLRDYFAAQYMQGLGAHYGACSDYASRAERCYRMADAMLKARNA